MKSNSYLTALIIWERILPILRLDSREQINRSNMKLIYDYTGHVVSQLNSVSFDNTLVLSDLIKAADIEKNLLDNILFKETDTEIKAKLGKMYRNIESVYLAAGQFYMENDFEYSPKYDTVLRDIIKVNLNHGFYFGYSA